MSAQEEGDRGPKISAERRSILDMIDQKIDALRKRENDMSSEGAVLSRQVLEATRSDIRQCLDVEEGGQ